MRSPLVSARTLLIASLIVVTMLTSVPVSRAEETGTDSVPEPWVNETHKCNVSGDIDGKPTDEYFVNERWSIEVRHGDVMTLIMARTITQDNVESVDYTNNIHYSIGGKLYIAQFMIIELVFKIGGNAIHAPLTTCNDFSLEYTPTVYDGTVPTLDCNITYSGIRVYPGSSSSTVDLTLLHHIRGDWNNTDIKIEAFLNFANTKFYDQNNGSVEFPAGEPFTAEIGYMMMLANPEDMRTTGPVIPSGYTNATLEYNMTLDSGAPLTVSKLEMRDNFSVYSTNGTQASVGYSSMEVHGGQAYVTHGFPGMSYKETQSMKSDPKITVFHDRVTENSNNPDGSGTPGSITPPWGLVAVVGVVGAACAIVGSILIRKRRKT